MVITGGRCNTCHGSTAKQQSAFTLEYFVPYCRSVRHVPTLKMRVVPFFVCIKNSTISSKHVHCCILVHVSCFFFWLGSCPLLYVRTSCVSCHPVSYIVSAYLVSYSLLGRESRVTGAQHSSSRLSLWSTSYHTVVACDTSPL